MPITRAIEHISPDDALEILASSNRSPTAPDNPELDHTTIDVLSSVPNIHAFTDDIVLANGHIVSGHDKLSAIALSDKVVMAWVIRENTLRPVE